MKTEAVPLMLNTLSDQSLIDCLNRGGVGVLPTDTTYGLVCRAADSAAAQRLFNLKQRDAKPGTLVAASIDQLIELGLKARYLKVVQQYWPGPISVVIPTYELTYLHLGLGSLAVRVSAIDQLNQLLAQVGPLLTSSANHPNEPIASNVAMAESYFGDKVDFYVDGGDLSGRQPSTLIRIVDDAVEILREGAVKIDAAGRVIEGGN